MNEFYKILKECSKDRLKEHQHQQNDINNQAATEFSLFKAWCRAYKNSEFTEKNFKEYSSNVKPNLSFWIKKKIFEMYYNYTFDYDYQYQKWICIKQSI